MKNITTVGIATVAKAGSMLDASIRDAIALAMEDGQNVTLDHNGAIFTIDPGIIVATIRQQNKNHDDDEIPF